MTRQAVIALAAVLLMVGCPKKNHAPDVPTVPVGPSAVAKGSSATFSSQATDPDGDSVSIRFDWGDGDTSDWSQYVESDEQVLMSHAWSAVGVCSLRAQAKDRGSLTSAWSLAHEVDVTAAADAWSRTFGGENLDFGYSVQQTSDGGYVIAGVTVSFGAGGYDVWLIKTDFDGNKVWDKTFGGTGWDEAYSVQQTSDGGYVIAGETESYGAGECDVWLIKTDATGRKVWDRTFGGAGRDVAHSAQQTSDGGYIIAGSTDSYGAGYLDVWLIKTNADGNRVWDRTFGGAGWDEAHSVKQTSDGGYIIAGETESYGAGWDDVWLIRTDASGSKVWDRTFGGERNDLGYSVQQTTDGGYIVVGETDSYGAGSGDVWLIKTDANGYKVWDRTFGGGAGSAVQQARDGGYIIAGKCRTGTVYTDAWLIKTDASGNKTWDRALGGTADDEATSVQQTLDGGYIITGWTFLVGAGANDVWLIKISGP